MGVWNIGKDGDIGEKEKEHGEGGEGKEEMTIEIERDMCMSEFSWYDPKLYINNGSNRILPGIQVGCMWYGVWGME